MSRASHLYTTLLRATEENEPGCAGDDRFIAEPGQVVEHWRSMRRICDACPLLDLCEQVGMGERAGMWAGFWQGQRDR